MESIWNDVRHGVRLLVKSPVVTLVAASSLALGIGANTAMFSWMQGLVLDPLRAPRPAELVHLYSTNPSGFRGNYSYPNFRDERERAEVLRGLVARRSAPVSLALGESSERAFAELVSADYFPVVGVEAALGRVFTEEEDSVPGRDAVVVLSHAFWERRLGGDSDVIGRSLRINGHPFTVAGVLPQDFRYATIAVDSDLYAPLAMVNVLMPGPDRVEARGWGFLEVFGRLAPGVSLETAQAHMEVVAAELARDFPDENENRSVLLVPEAAAILPGNAHQAMVGTVAVLMGVVGIVLLIACANVANLQMARALGRRTEISVRRALGADRRRILRQLLTESLLLSGLSAIGGVGLAYALNQLLLAIPLPVGLPVSFDVSLDARVLGFTVAVAVLAGVLFGLFPALQATSAGLAAVAGTASARVVGSSRFRHALVAGQVALSLVLLVGAALFLESFRAAQDIDPGFDAEGVLLASMDPNLQGYTEEASRQFYASLAERVAGRPGVRSVALAEHVPLVMGGSQWGVEIEGYEPAPDERMNVDYNTVTPGYFETMGIPLLAGRAFTAADRDDAEGTVIINETMAERFWPGADPLGRRLRSGGRDRVVVGVVGDSKAYGLGEPPLAFMYFPYEQTSYGAPLTLHVRAEGKPLTLADAVRSEVRALDPGLPVFDLQPLEERVGLALLPSRLSATVLGAFGAVALLMAAVGIYGVMAFTVGQRTREIGLRMALGATRRQILELVLAQGAWVLASGLALGLAGGFGLARVVAGLLYGSGLDLTSLAAAAASILAVALLASYLPARRAARIDPTTALRYE